MTIVLISLFGSLLVVVVRGPGPLTRRLAALRGWPAQKNRPIRQ
ncbi:MAG TPA: hypothetical protein VFB31_04040 [Pseudolabrys sp.]|nr:hypothetical protein [Pseudolabrys sp.]